MDVVDRRASLAREGPHTLLDLLQIMAQVQMAQTLASSQPVATLVKSVPAPTGSIPNVTIPVSINVSNQQKVVAANRATVSQLHQQQKLHLLQQQQQQRKVTPQMQAQKMQSISHLQSRGIPLIIPNKNIPGSSQLTQTLLQQIVKQQQQQQAQGGLTGVTTHGSQPTIIVSQNPPAGASATATVVPKSSIATAVQSSQIQTMAASAPITITQVPAASTAAASSAVSSVTGMAQAVMKAVSGTPGVSTVQLHTMPAGGVGQQAAVQRASLPQSLMTTTQLAQQQAAAQPQQQQVAAHPSPASTPTQQLASPGTPTTLQTIQVQAAVAPPASPSPTPTQPQIPGTPTQIPGGSVSPSQQPKASPYAMRTRNTPKHS